MTDHAAASPGLARSGVAAPDRHRANLLSAVRRPSWTTLSLVGLLAATAALYLWSLGASGWANGFYSAAVLAATKSWKAFLFGSFDSSNFITVDKPPASSGSTPGASSSPRPWRGSPPWVCSTPPCAGISGTPRG